jgi:hypothetical protein
LHVVSPAKVEVDLVLEALVATHECTVGAIGVEPQGRLVARLSLPAIGEHQSLVHRQTGSGVHLLVGEISPAHFFPYSIQVSEQQYS